MIIKGQVIKVVSTGNRFRLDRVEKHRSEQQYQFYPVKNEFPHSHIYPFKISEDHFKQMVERKHMIIEPIQKNNGNTGTNIRKSE